MREWISVKDRLPNTSKTYLAVCVKIYIHKGILKRSNPCFNILFFDVFDSTWDADNLVTHWMPLPEPPKEEE